MRTAFCAGIGFFAADLSFFRPRYGGKRPAGTPMRLRRFRYAYAKLRSWHVGVLVAVSCAARYVITGDSGHVRSHGGWRKSRPRSATAADSD